MNTAVRRGVNPGWFWFFKLLQALVLNHARLLLQLWRECLSQHRVRLESYQWSGRSQHLKSLGLFVASTVASQSRCQREFKLLLLRCPPHRSLASQRLVTWSFAHNLHAQGHFVVLKLVGYLDTASFVQVWLQLLLNGLNAEFWHFWRLNCLFVWYIRLEYIMIELTGDVFYWFLIASRWENF